MKHIVKIAGLCLASMLVLGMAITATASAAPHWLQCREGSGTGTKWEDSKCSKIGSPNKWEWVELQTTEKATIEGTLHLTDKKGGLFGEQVVILCSGTGEGTIGPGGFDRILKIKASKCENEENCPGEITAEGVNLPWQTSLELVGGKIRDKITSEVSGKEPGWKVTCAGVADTCEANTTTAMENNQPLGSVDAVFDATSGTAKCSRGGAGQGEVRGTTLIRSAEGWAVSVSP